MTTAADDIADESTYACEVCGWMAAFASMIAFGSFGVPVKSKVAQNLDVDPLVMQSYKSVVCFLTSWFVLLIQQSSQSPTSSYSYGDSDDHIVNDDEWISSTTSSQSTTLTTSTSFQFTPWGIVSGLFWVPGGVATIYAIQNAGLCVSLGISSSCIVLVSFTWGIFVFDEQVHSRVQSTFAVLCMVCGIVGMTYFSSPTSTSTSSSASTISSLSSSETNNNGVEIMSVKTTNSTNNQQPIMHTRNMPSSLVYQKVPTTNPAGDLTTTTTTTSTRPISTNNAINTIESSNTNNNNAEASYQDEPGVHVHDINGNGNDNDNDKNVILHRERLGGSSTATATSESSSSSSPSTCCTTKTTSLNGIGYPVVSNQDEEDKEEDGRGDVHDGMIRPPLRNRRNRFRGILAAMFNGVYGGSIMVPMRYAPPEASGKLYVISFSIGALIVTVGLWVLRFMYIFVQQQQHQKQQRYGYGHGPSSSSSSSFVEAYQMLPSFHFRQMWYYGGLCGLLWSIGNFFSILSVSYLGEGVGYSVIQCAMIVSGLWGIFYFHELQDPRRICLWFGSATVAITGILILSYEHHAVSE